MKVNFYNAKKLKYLNVLNSGKAKRNSRGEIIKDAVFQKRTAPVGRIEPTRAWFTNTKTVTQNELDEYREAVKTKSPYNVLLSMGSVPYSLINNEVKLKRKHSFANCFGSKTGMKKPRLSYKTLEDIIDREDKNETIAKEEQKNKIKGQSHRIWNELYKVIDSSDVVVHVLDARDPMGTKCDHIEAFIKNKAQHKHFMYVLNKVDLVPTSVTAKWLRILSKEHPCIAYHSNSLENHYGKNNLMNVFRQLKTLYKKETLSIGFVGYPNSGKSSIINTLRNKKVCKSAPVPGETKVWQYVTLMKDIYLIDSPGVVPISDYTQAVLKGAIRVENVEMPEEFLPEVIKIVGKEAVEKSYGIEFEEIDDFFIRMAKRYGKIVKGGEPNIDIISKMVLHDLHRGKIPYFVEPEVEE
ncbi:GTPase required for pre-60S ribosomal subunit nuclear export and maturation [Glugoides intestinalis]